VGKHNWTDDEREIVRRDYRGTNASAEAIAHHLGQVGGKEAGSEDGISKGSPQRLVAGGGRETGATDYPICPKYCSQDDGAWG